MAKYRIIKPAGFTFLHKLQKWHFLFGWVTIFSGPLWGCETELRDKRDSKESKIEEDVIIREEEF